MLLLGGDARCHAIAEAITRSDDVDLYAIAHNYNPGIAKLSREFEIHEEQDIDWVLSWAIKRDIELAVIGPEGPLDVGLPSALIACGIASIGPTTWAARVETSKRYLRDLMANHNIAGAVEYKYFDDADELAVYIVKSGREFALKPIGLTGGKGVKVMGIQLESVKDAIAYGRSVIEQKIGNTAGILLEERLVGPEYTLQAFVDSKTMVPMPLVRDFKLAYEGDKGPYTGSMGSYSQADGLLSYVSSQDRDFSLAVMRQIVAALRNEHILYKGIMYGQFCRTVQGPKLVEINARFGDPEAINVLALLETNFLDICRAIVKGTLHRQEVQFSSQATACKYITPPGYPEDPVIGVPLRLNQRAIEAKGVKAYFAQVDGKSDGNFTTTKSRSLALLATADTIAQAEAKVESALQHVVGKYHLRHDIGRNV